MKMKFYISISDNKIWLTLDNKITHLIESPSDLDSALSSLDTKTSKRIVKMIHRIRTGKSASINHIPRIICSVAVLIGVFWAGSAIMYSLQALTQDTAISSSISQSKNSCQNGVRTKSQFENQQAHASLKNSLEIANKAAASITEPITDEMMDNTIYEFGYN